MILVSKTKKEYGGLTVMDSEINLNQLPESGVRVLKDFEGTPNKEGILKKYNLVLPSFRKGCYFSADGRPEWPHNANRVLPWIIEDNFKDLFRGGYCQNPATRPPDREGMLTVLKLETGEYLMLLPIAGPLTMSWLRVDEDGQLRLYMGNLGTESVKCDVPLLAWARSEDVYAAFRETWKQAITCDPVAVRTAWRENKNYPEPFMYLGWCSWEQYKRRINEKLLCNVARKLKESELPVRWMLVDDGHQTQEDSKLKSFAPNPEKFPYGWTPLLKMRSEEGVKWMGLWLCFQGHWATIHSENDLGSLNEHLYEYRGKIFPKDTFEASRVFYDAFIGSAKMYGFDFVKMDDQTGNLMWQRGTANAVKAAAQNSQAMEEAVRRDMKGMINCMAHNSVCVFNTRFSNVTRCSIDYKVGDSVKAKSHIHQSYNNTLWIGQTVWPDHDMFHSSDPNCGRMMALSKALSGGPVYLSDAPEEFVAEYICPLCFKDGELLRPLAPAVPLPDSVFLDALNEQKAYRVIAPLPHRCAAVAVYSLVHPTPKDLVTASVSAADYTHASALIQPYPRAWKQPEKGLVVYDWYKGEGRKLDKPYEFKMEGFADRLLLLCPIKKGWAVIGRVDKYLSPAAVIEISYDEKQLILKMRESGPLVVWSGKGKLSSEEFTFKDIGHGLWKADVSKGERCKEIIVRR